MPGGGGLGIAAAGMRGRGGELRAVHLGAAAREHVVRPAGPRPVASRTVTIIRTGQAKTWSGTGHVEDMTERCHFQRVVRTPARRISVVVIHRAEEYSVRFELAIASDLADLKRELQVGRTVNEIGGGVVLLTPRHDADIPRDDVARGALRRRSRVVSRAAGAKRHKRGRREPLLPVCQVVIAPEFQLVGDSARVCPQRRAADQQSHDRCQCDRFHYSDLLF